MILDAIGGAGPWVWLILGFVLLIGEVFVPGAWLLWFGFAAITVGGLTLLPFSDLAGWGWQGQVIAFALLSGLFVLIGRKVLPQGASVDADAMNRPLDRLVGREAVLAEAISGGVGRVRLGDTLWRAAGPDLPSGARVRVVGHDGDRLRVEPI